MRERWLGATGRKVPQIAVEGEDLEIPDGALVLEDVGDVAALARAHRDGVPVLVRAASAEGVKEALARPEVAAVLVPPSARELRELDLAELTYG